LSSQVDQRYKHSNPQRIVALLVIPKKKTERAGVFEYELNTWEMQEIQSTEFGLMHIFFFQMQTAFICCALKYV
jgi:hypothetical protein